MILPTTPQLGGVVGTKGGQNCISLKGTIHSWITAISATVRMVLEQAGYFRVAPVFGFASPNKAIQLAAWLAGRMRHPSTRMPLLESLN